MNDSCTDAVFTSTAIVAVAGVMCRGARWGIHLAWASTYAHIVAPLRAQGVNVEIWAFNNIPPSIDGCIPPADGGRSFFGTLDYYESHLQHDIDASAEASHIDAVQSVVGLAGHSFSANMLRALFLEGRACARLRAEWESGRLPADTVVYLMSPDLLYYDRRLILPAMDPNKTRLWVIGKTHHSHEKKSQGLENGWLAGRVSTVVQFHEQRMRISTQARATYYESWLWQLLRRGSFSYIVHPGRAMEAHVSARCLRGYASPPPWDWKTKGLKYGKCTWQQVPKAVLLRSLETLAQFQDVPVSTHLVDARTWVPLDRAIAHLLTDDSCFSIDTAGAPLQTDPLPATRAYIVEWCGGDTVRLHCLRTGLFLARDARSTALTASAIGDSLTRFTCTRSDETSWQTDAWCLSFGPYNLGIAPQAQGLRMVPALSEWSPTVVLQFAPTDSLCPELPVEPYIPCKGGGSVAF